MDYQYFFVSTEKPGLFLKPVLAKNPKTFKLHTTFFMGGDILERANLAASLCLYISMLCYVLCVAILYAV